MLTGKRKKNILWSIRLEEVEICKYVHVFVNNTSFINLPLYWGTFVWSFTNQQSKFSFFLAARPHPLCHLGINSNRILWEFLTYLVLFVVRINKYAKVKWLSYDVVDNIYWLRYKNIFACVAVGFLRNVEGNKGQIN